MSSGSAHDGDLTSWFCANLPLLREAAVRRRWADKLEAAVDDVKSGVSIELALRRRRLPADALRDAATTRGDPLVLDAFGLEPAPATGGYRCPGPTSCDRDEARDANGHEPQCTLLNLPMTPYLRRSR